MVADVAGAEWKGEELEAAACCFRCLLLQRLFAANCQYLHVHADKCQGVLVGPKYVGDRESHLKVSSKAHELKKCLLFASGGKCMLLLACNEHMRRSRASAHQS